MCGLWRENSGTVPVARAGPLLAQRVPQVLLLRGDARGHRLLLLHEGRNDSLQAGLHEVNVYDELAV